MSSDKLAVQMYTVREFLKNERDLAESLAKISAIGYPAVQLSAVAAMNGDNPEVSVTQAKKMLDDNGLKCIATHRGWDNLAQRTDEEIDFHRTLECDFVAIGGVPQSYAGKGAEGYEQFAHDAVPVLEKLKAAGIRFGYHNHAHEFERVGSGRRSLYDILLEQGGPNMLMEIDIYWVQHAGLDPVRVVERCHGRMPVIHLKDKEVANREPVMAPIGEGNLDWERILPACATAGVEWYAVEQDNYRRDPFDCLKSSFEFLSAQKEK
ncbi:MAG: sugar phosphate isomerase/epimerase [Abitibacteriaceae bacterium]|nr:sugar phosphate isomerase/epimerase [Abditibacteriaceae bacterium]